MSLCVLAGDRLVIDLFIAIRLDRQKEIFSSISVHVDTISVKSLHVY